MAGLLDFALGFGQGAAGAVAYDRKSQLDMQRQANLDRLRAQYATEQKFESAGRVADLAASDDERDQVQAQILGYKPAQPDKGTTNQQDFEYFVSLLSEGKEEAATLFGRQSGVLPTDTDPGSVREVNALADAAGIPRGSPEYISMLNERIMKPDTQINMGETESAFAKELGKQDVDRLGQIEQRSLRAMDQRAELDRIDAALESGGFTTGAFADQRQFLSRMATLAGLEVGEIPGLGSAATADTIDSAANLIAGNLLGDIASNSSMRGSVALLNLVKESGPQLARTPEGNKIIVEVLKRKGEREMEVARIAQEYARLGTFRPEGMPSFMEAVIELNETEPVVTEELRERIMTARDVAPDAGSMVEQFRRGASIGGPAEQGTQLPRVTATTAAGALEQMRTLGIQPGDRYVAPDGTVRIRSR